MIIAMARAWQTHWHKHPGVRSGDQLSLGERAADRMRNVMGSWPFVFSFFGIMALWVIVNTVLLQHVLSGKAFDPYPYILLNLFLSMLAGVQAAALLIAAKRADAISSEIAIHTEHNTDDIRALLDENKRLLAENTALTSEVKKTPTSSKRSTCTWPTSARRLGQTWVAFLPAKRPQCRLDLSRSSRRRQQLHVDDPEKRDENWWRSVHPGQQGASPLQPPEPPSNPVRFSPRPRLNPRRLPSCPSRSALSGASPKALRVRGMGASSSDAQGLADSCAFAIDNDERAPLDVFANK